MGSIDPSVLFRFPFGRTTGCFKDVLDSYQDEYFELLDYLRVSRPEVKNPTCIPDVVDFLSGLQALRTRPHLRCLFRLSCLCLTENGAPLPLVKSPCVDTSDFRCKYREFIQPVQSFLTNVLEGLSVCISDVFSLEFNAL